MQPDVSPILEQLSITEPLVGFYDAPDAAPFAPLVVPKGRQCVFKSLEDWREGKTLHLTKDKHGCGGMHLLGLHGALAGGPGGVPVRRRGPEGLTTN